MKCPFCNSELEDPNINFCPICGGKIPKEAKSKKLDYQNKLRVPIISPTRSIYQPPTIPANPEEPIISTSSNELYPLPL